MCLLIAPVFLQAQRLIDQPATVQKVQQAVDYIYGFQFNKAEQAIRSLESTIGQHPGYSLLQALKLYWQYYPLQQDTKPHAQYEELLLQTADRAGKILKNDKHEVEGVFFSLAAYGYLTSYFADNGNLIKTINYAKKSYSFLTKGMEMKSKYVEFYFTTGLYNYYREKYPENNAAYKPFLWVFQSGDKQQGIAQLQKAADHATFTKCEALNYLFHIQLHYESNPVKSFQHAKRLHTSYPENDVFLTFYIENLIALNKITEAIPLINKIDHEGPFFDLSKHLFKGILEEKFFDNLDQALEFYTTAINKSQHANTDVDHYIAMCYAGKARCYDLKGMKTQAEDHYKKCLDYADYDIIRDEAEAYLNN